MKQFNQELWLIRIRDINYMKGIIMASIQKTRQWIWTFLTKRKINGYKGSLKCNHYCSFNGNTFCGYNCNFNGIRVMGRGKVVIGDNFHSGAMFK